jgi:nicotinamide phosphoribosyltransferase
MSLLTANTLLATDVYKLGHMEFYPEGTTKIYSYLIARSSKKFNETVFFGLQAFLKEYLTRPITDADVDEFLEYRKMILGANPKGVVKKMRALAKLGYWPISIKSVPEGSIVDVRNVLFTMTNTHPDFAWTVGYLESLILKVWNTTTVATSSLGFYRLFEKYAQATSDSGFLVPFQVHDFGYRGCSSEETAALSGMSHLTSFLGTDTVLAVKAARQYYNAGKDGKPVGLSVPATEHSVMCAFGREFEFDAFARMLQQNPAGIVSIVSDTYNLWNVLTNFAPRLKEEILARDGKVVFRPDSGEPKLILCGNPAAKEGSPEWKGVIRLLDEVFGHTVNSKGYKELNPKVGTIYGDGMYFARITDILGTLKEMGYATTNLVIGVGGILLQQHNRDDLGFAIKATFATVTGEDRELFKDPITDPGKRSHKGLLRLDKINGVYVTTDRCTPTQESGGLLEEVFRDGKILREFTFTEVRDRIRAEELARQPVIA